MAESLIQVLPNGLQGMLDLKGAGALPQTLATQLQATWDIGQFYVTQQAADSFVLQTQNIAAVGFQGFAQLSTAASKERLAVRAVGFYTDTLSAGEAITFSGPILTRSNVGPPLVSLGVGQLQSEVMVATQAGGVGAYFEPAFIMPPNWFFGIMVKSFTVGADITGSMWFARLPV